MRGRAAALLFAVIVIGVAATPVRVEKWELILVTLWDQYRWYAVGVLTMLGQSALIGGLCAQRAGRRRAEVALQASQSALRSRDQHVQTLAGRLIAAQEDERARIARELHDDLSQRLALLSIGLTQLVGHTGGSDDLTHRARAAVASVGEIATGIHNLSHELHPARLQMLGLTPALRTLCRDMSSAHNVRIEFDHGPLNGPIPYQAALCLFRVAQEALRNVVKHSVASAAQVRLSQAQGMLRLLITDSGRGFSPRLAVRGLGLVSMRERVHFVGGQIWVQSMPGRGTRIDVKVPVEWEWHGTQAVAIG